MSAPNIAIAALLFMLTCAAAFVSWYIVRGRRKHAAKKERQQNDSKEKEQAAAKGKNSYSHPAINDLMGFEFITVVDVPKELLEDKRKNKETAPEEEKTSWENSRGLGMTAAGTDEAVSEDDIHDFTQPRGNAEKEKDGQEEKSFPEVMEEDVTPLQLEAINRLPGEWGHRDIDEELPDETVDIILDRNRDMLESRELTPEDLRAARDRELAERMFAFDNSASKAEEYDEDFNRLIDEFDDMEEGTGQDETEDPALQTDFEQNPDEKDIPEI